MKHFVLEEFQCKCCRELPVDGMNPVLLEALDQLREEYGKPIYVSCGYRCPSHNAEVGGVSNSQHLLGNAADIYVDGNYEDFYNLVLDSGLFDGVGSYPCSEFIHVDERNDGNIPNEYTWEE